MFFNMLILLFAAKKKTQFFSPRHTRARAATETAMRGMDAASARAVASLLALDAEEAEEAGAAPSSPEPSVGGSPARTPAPRRIPLDRKEEGTVTPEARPIPSPTPAKRPKTSRSRTLSPRKHILFKMHTTVIYLSKNYIFNNSLQSSCYLKYVT